ncbi:MAG TPA: ABC transporter permease [Candidatus Saccharimonadales bacterium]|nr:ABC transporter permease [Candidatus Saccharimonadales bacterium]
MKSIAQRYRYSLILLRELVITDFKLRYQGSFLGYLWSLLRPLGLFVILYLVFVRFLKFGADIPNFPIYLLLGIVLWNYFADVTNGGIGAIVSRGDLLRKLNFPKYVIVLAGSFSALINLLINFGVVFAFMIFKDVDFQLHGLLAPIVVFELFLFSLAMAFLLSALFVRLRDINYVWEVFMQGAFYATPVIYPITMLPVSAAKILLLNPVAQMIQDLRYLLVTPQTPTISSVYGNDWIRLVPITMVVFFMVIAVWYFRRNSPKFAEEI